MIEIRFVVASKVAEYVLPAAPVFAVSLVPSWVAKVLAVAFPWSS